MQYLAQGRAARRSGEMRCSHSAHNPYVSFPARSTASEISDVRCRFRVTRAIPSRSTWPRAHNASSLSESAVFISSLLVIGFLLNAITQLHAQYQFTG